MKNNKKAIAIITVMPQRTTVTTSHANRVSKYGNVEFNKSTSLSKPISQSRIINPQSYISSKRSNVSMKPALVTNINATRPNTHEPAVLSRVETPKKAFRRMKRAFRFLINLVGGKEYDAEDDEPISSILLKLN